MEIFFPILLLVFNVFIPFICVNAAQLSSTGAKQAQSFSYAPEPELEDGFNRTRPPSKTVGFTGPSTPPNYYTGDLPTAAPASYEDSVENEIGAGSATLVSRLPLEQMPYFVEAMSSPNMTAANPGENAVMTCAVRNLGDHLIIWRRADQLVPLTIGTQRHVLDERITAEGNSMTGEWSLVIREARLSDSGMYRCQINVIQDDGSYMERRIQLRVRDIPLLVIDAHEAGRSDSHYVKKLVGMTSLPRPVLFDLLTTLPRSLKSTSKSIPSRHHSNASPVVDLNSTQPQMILRGLKGVHSQPNKRGKHLLNSIDGLIPPLALMIGDLAIGGSEYVERGQNIELSCNATSMLPHSESAPSNLEWYKDGEKLESSTDSGVFITKHAVGRTLYSTLIVYKADTKSAGDYVCRVADLNAVENYKVTVLNVQPGTVKRGTASLVGGHMNASNIPMTFWLSNILLPVMLSISVFV